MMQTAGDRAADEPLRLGALWQAPRASGRFVAKRLMQPHGVVIRQIFTQDATQMLFVQHDRVVETLPANGTNYPLGNGVGLRSASGRQDGRDPEPGSLADEVTAVSAIAVSDQEAGMHVPLRRRQDLPPYPLGVRMAGDVPVHDTSAVVVIARKT